MPRRRRAPALTIVTLAIAAAAAAPSTRQKSPPSPDPAAAAARITQEVQRLERAAATLAPVQGLADLVGRAGKAVEASRLYLALDELQDPWTFEQASRFAADHAAVATPDQFAREWRRLGEPRMTGTASARVPIVVRAIAQAAASRGPATWRASLPYSEDSDLRSGLYYLGESRAFTGFADFCLSLPLGSARTPAPSTRDLAGAISAIEAEAARGFDQADADTRPRFIRVNVALKIARTLVDGHQTEGALLEYLVATYRLGNVVAPAPPGAAEDIARRLDLARGSLDARVDHSIAQLFLERGAALLESGDAAAIRSAAVIADLVLPAYVKVTQS